MRLLLPDQVPSISLRTSSKTLRVVVERKLSPPTTAHRVFEKMIKPRQEWRGFIMARNAILCYSAYMDLAKEFKKYSRSHAFFYVTLDPERALGLEDILPNYTIICPYKSRLTEKLKREGIEIFVLEDLIGEGGLEEVIQRGTYGVLSACGRSPEGRQLKIIGKNDYVMVLKNSELIEDFCKKQGWKLLAPKAKVAEQFENKISQYKLLKDVAPYPKTLISTIKKLTGSDPVSFAGVRPRGIVLQFNRGHSGNSTFFINSAKDLAALAKKFPKREAKISEYIKGKTYTLNCIVLKSGEVITGSLSEQITGLKSATNNPNTTCGNDFVSPGKLKKAQVKKIPDIAQNVGRALYKKGYRGLFGIDVIIESGTNKAYFIEVNTHQPASVSFEAKLHREIGKVPILSYFILDSLGVDSSPYEGEEGRGPRTSPSPSFVRRGMPPIVLPISARQIIYRNKTSRVLTRRDVEGKYKGKGLISRMKYIKPNEEIFRKQLVR